MIHGILLDISDDEICSVLCKECNASAVFVNNQCNCNFNDDNEGIVLLIHRYLYEINY